MNKTFYDMKTNVGKRVQDPSTAFATILGTFINKRYFQILRSANISTVRSDYTLTTVSGTQEYALPEDFGKEISVRDTTNGLEITKTDLQKLITDYSDSVDSTGSCARYYTTEGSVLAQPTSASLLAISSSSGSDTSITILVRGVLSTGSEVSESVTLTGTTPANTTNQYSRVKAISKSGATVGLVTVTSNSAAVTVATLSPQVTTSYCKKIGFHYVPSTALVISVPYLVKPLPMSSDYDYPIIDVADLIEIGAEADAWKYKRQFGKYNTLETQFNIELQQYIFDRENEPNKVTQFTPAVYNMDNLY